MKAVIFDMDGVLIDSEPIHRAVEREVFSSLGVHITEAEHLRYLGVSWDDMIADVRDRTGCAVTAEAFQEAVGAVRARVLPADGEPFVAGALELVREVSDTGVPVGIASSSSRIHIERTIRRGQLENAITAFTGGDEVERSKPDPEVFLRTAGRLGVKPDACIVVEDSPNGIRAAVAAGMTCLGFVNPGSGSPDISSANVVCESMDEVRRSLFAFLSVHRA